MINYFNFTEIRIENVENLEIRDENAPMCSTAKIMYYCIYEILNIVRNT